MTNPDKCEDGFSLSLFYKADYKETDSELANPQTKFPREVILSTGGDKGFPGLSIYREGGTLGVILSTGAKLWTVQVVGGIPQRGKWTNIGIRWRNLNYASEADFATRHQEGEEIENEDFGGLAVFLDLKRVGFVHLPEDIEEKEVKSGLDPAEILLGCHKTSADLTKRNFSGGSFDEVAIWTYWLNDTLLPYFLGGYSN